MLKRVILLVCLIFSSGFLSATPAYAQMDREEIFTFLQNAFQAQLELTKEYKTMSEVENVLSPYFTSDYVDTFLDEHLFKGEEGHKILGSDVFTYFIPFYSYKAPTKIMSGEDQIIVYEFFPASYEGPVIWDDHYEAVVMTHTDKGWKISDYLYRVQAPSELE